MAYIEMIFSSSPDVFLALLDDLGLKIGFSVPGDILVDLAELGFDGLGSETVSGVVGGLSFLVVGSDQKDAKNGKAGVVPAMLNPRPSPSFCSLQLV